MESCAMEDSQTTSAGGEIVDALNRTEAKTWNDAVSNPSPDPSGEKAGRMALFFKSVRGLTDDRLEEYLTRASKESLVDTFLIAFHIRDCRGGKGERELGRKCLRWLSRHAQHFRAVIEFLAEYGRWDDYILLLRKLAQPLGKKKGETKEIVSAATGPFAGIENASLAQNMIRLLAGQLKKDLLAMTEGKPCSLAAKWAPTENCSLDRQYGVVTKIAKELKISVRNYRKTYLAPLRAYLKVVERYMCNKSWDAIEYSAVPSCAMKRLKKAFARNDSQRFEEWKTKLQKGEVKVNAKQLFPHELVREVVKEDDNVVSEAQWKVLVEETKKLGVFKKSLVVVDVSASMGRMSQSTFCPIHASVALGLIISECLEGPLRNQIITFHENPTFFAVQGSDLKRRIAHLTQAPWGGNTNFQKVFDLILTGARHHELKQEDMPEFLYILSDMQFDRAMGPLGGESTTNYTAVKEKYAEAGYTPPQIIFWNLNGASDDFPCTVDDDGTAMISGFSTAILKSILTLGKVDPYNAMRVTLDAERYQPVKTALEALDSEMKVEETPEEAGAEGASIPTYSMFSGWFGKS